MAGLGMISPEWAKLRKSVSTAPAADAATIGGAPSVPSDDQIGDLRSRQQHHLRAMDQPFRSGWASVYGATQSIVNGALAGQYGLKLDEATAAQKQEADGKKAAEDSVWDQMYGSVDATPTATRPMEGPTPEGPPVAGAGMARPMQGPTPEGPPMTGAGMAADPTKVAAQPQPNGGMSERQRWIALGRASPQMRQFAMNKIADIDAEDRRRASPEYGLDLELKRAQVAKEKRGPERKYQEINGRIVALDPYGGPAEEVYSSPNAGQEKAPAGFEWNPDKPGSLRPIPGGPGEFKSFTETQTKDANLGARMLRAEENLQNVMQFDPETNTFKGYDPTPGKNAWFPDSGYMGMANAFNSKDWQKYIQASRESMAALLRKDTGAAVTDTEFDLYFPMYYPQPGDDPEVVKQKMAARQEIAKGLAIGSGGAFDLSYPDSAKQIKGGPQPSNAPAPVSITSDQEWEALPKGTRFSGPDGQVRIK